MFLSRTILIGVIGGAALLTTAATESPAADATVSVTGAVQEFYSRAPQPDLKVTLSPLSCDIKGQAAQTDAQGRFRFDEIPGRCTGFTIYGQRPTDKYGSMLLDGAAKPVTVKAPSDLGTVYLRDQEWPTRQFGGVCAGQKPAAEVGLPNNIVVLWQGASGWTSTISTADRWESRRVLPWPAVLCLADSYKEVWKYEEVKDGRAAGGTAGRAMKTTTQAEVVRLRDGKRFKTKASAEPPKRVLTYTGGDQYGDTSGAIEAWLATLASSER